MKSRIPVLVAALVLTSNAFSQGNTSFKAPRNEWGQPDLNGVWNFASNTPMQRPERWG